MQQTSIWRSKNPPATEFLSLAGDATADIAIVGAGITGLTTAYESLKKGKSVVVVEAGMVGGGTTGNSTGNLYIEVQDLYQTIREKHGLETTQMVFRSRNQAINYIESTAAHEGIACDFHRRPWFFYTNDDSKIKKVEREHDVLCEAGVTVVDARWPLPIPVKRWFCIENQARFDPLMYVRGLAKAVARLGGTIYEQSAVTKIDEDSAMCTVHTHGGSVRAKHLILATHMPIGFKVVQTAAAPYRSYVVSGSVSGEALPDGQFWDADKPHHVTSTHSDHNGDVNQIVVAGSHHKTGQANGDHREHYEELERFLRHHFRMQTLDYRWSAQHYRPVDALPYIGHATVRGDRVLMATGFAADGLTYGTVAGIMLAELADPGDHEWRLAYDPGRFTVGASAKDFLKENINVAAQYVKDYTFRHSADDFEEVKAGSAKVLTVNGERCAAHRDDAGQLHVVSAVCTHLACIVSWNEAERTWDCPCHGSRFDISGTIIEGPALSNLKKVDLEAAGRRRKKRAS